MFEYVKDYGLKFKGTLVPRKSTKRILLHETCGGPLETVLGIHAYHLSRGHKGIDYNICVEKDGGVVWGRGLEYCGGSVNNSSISTKGMNDDSVAIVALGNFDIDQMPEAQKDGIKRITREVAQYYRITEIKGHNEVAGRDYTTCPGQYFPLDEIRAYALGNDQALQPAPEQTREEEHEFSNLFRNLKLVSPMMRGDDVRKAQERLECHLAEPGKIDGVFGKNTKAATVRFQKARIAEGYDLGSAGADGVIGPKTWKLLR